LLSCDIDALLQGADAVINAAGVMGVPGTAGTPLVNLEGTRRVIEAASRQGVRRFIHISTCMADAESDNWYARSKGLGERVVTESGRDWTVLRPTEIYGTGSKWFDHTAAALATKRLVFTCTDLGQIAPVHVADVAAATIRSLGEAKAHSRTYTLAGPSIGLVEFYEGVRRAIDGRYRIVGLTERQIRLLIAVSGLLPRLNRRARQLLAVAGARAVKVDSSSAVVDLNFDPRRFPSS
jgi:uncharacterized protein YbjT (DUF2867 family)